MAKTLTTQGTVRGSTDKRLEVKIKATQREVSQLSELQKGAMKMELPKEYNKLSIDEALETAKQ